MLFHVADRVLNRPAAALRLRPSSPNNASGRDGTIAECRRSPPMAKSFAEHNALVLAEFGRRAALSNDLRAEFHVPIDLPPEISALLRRLDQAHMERKVDKRSR